MVSDVNGFICLGVGLIIIGIIWLAFDAEITDFEDEFISTPYLEIMDTGWNSYPLIVFLLGGFCLVIGIKTGGDS